MQYLAAIVLTSLGVLSRTSFHLGQNIEFITAIGLVSGFLFTKPWLKFSTALVAVVVSDLIIGNTNIIWFTWSAYLVAPLFGILLRRIGLQEFASNLTGMQLAGVCFTLLFFLWTNLGVVLTTNMYSKDLTGLVQSYINALPFLQNQLLGNLIVVPLLFAAVSLAKYLRSLHLSSQLSAKI